MKKTSKYEILYKFNGAEKCWHCQFCTNREPIPEKLPDEMDAEIMQVTFRHPHCEKGGLYGPKCCANYRGLE